MFFVRSYLYFSSSCSKDFFFFVCTWSYPIGIYFKQIYLSQSETESNCNWTLPRSPGLEPCPPVHFSIITWTPILDVSYSFARNIVRIFLALPTGCSLAWWLECSPMARETWVQSQVKLYQWLLKWYLMIPCLTLSIIRYGSMVKWSNPEKGVALPPTPWCSSYRKGNLRVILDYGRQLWMSVF